MSESARTQQRTPTPAPATRREVVFLLFDGVELLDVAGPAEVLHQTADHLPVPPYRLRYVAANASGSVRSSAGVGLAVEPLPDHWAEFDLLVVPGAAPHAIEAACADQRLLGALAAAWPQARRRALVCSGALLAAQIGVLAGRRVTTHWQVQDRLAEAHPGTAVDADALFVRDGDLWSSAGILSGVDMALAMVRDDLGAAIALAVARTLVVYLVRPGGQSQFSGSIDLQTRATSYRLDALVAWLRQQIDRPIDVETMAAQAALSVRTLRRRCRDAFGLSPAQLLAELRLDHARTLLLDLELSLQRIATACGFASSSALSRAFTRRFGVAPTTWRIAFGAAATAPHSAGAGVRGSAYDN